MARILIFFLMALSTLSAELFNAFIASDANGAKDANGSLFESGTFGGALFVMQDGTIVSLASTETNGSTNGSKNGSKQGVFIGEKLGFDPRKVTPKDPLSYKVSQLGGTEKTPYQTLDLGEISKGISAKLIARANNVERIFTLAPQESIAALKIELLGVKSIKINEKGELVLDTPIGAAVMSAPKAFQEIGGKRESIAVKYRIIENGYGFALGGYNRRYPVIIDPLLAATYTGGTADDAILAVKAVKGAVYAAGYTHSPSIAVGSVYNSAIGLDPTGFVAKYDENLTTLQALTYIGGNGADQINAIAIAGNYLYAVGKTTSTNVKAAINTPRGNDDGLILRLDRNLQCTSGCARFVGGSNKDTLTSIAVSDDNLTIFVAGQTLSAGGFDLSFASSAGTQNGNWDGFVAAFSASTLAPAPAAPAPNAAFVRGGDRGFCS